MKKIWVVLIAFALVFGQTGSLILADDMDTQEMIPDPAEGSTEDLPSEITDGDAAALPEPEEGGDVTEPEAAGSETAANEHT